MSIINRRASAPASCAPSIGSDPSPMMPMAYQGARYEAEHPRREGGDAYAFFDVARAGQSFPAEVAHA